MIEEAEALLHSSKLMNKAIKTCLALVVVVVVTSIQFMCQMVVISTLTYFKIYIGIMFDLLSLWIAYILFGLYSDASNQTVQILGSASYVAMLFFSTTFSPGAGLEGLKALRYLFPRFYLWCMLPGDISLEMEGCPESSEVLYLVLASLVTPLLFVLAKVGMNLYKKSHKEKKQASLLECLKTKEFAELQLELFGEKALKNLKHLGRNSIELNTIMTGVDRNKDYLTKKQTEFHIFGSDENV